MLKLIFKLNILYNNNLTLPLFGAELVELLAGSLQQPQASQVPTGWGGEQNMWKKPEHDSCIFAHFTCDVLTLPSY